MKGYHQAWRWSCDTTAASETLVPYSDLGLPWPKSPHQAQVRLALLLKAAPASPQPLQPAFPSWTPVHNPGRHSLGPRGPRPATSQVFLEPPEQGRAPVCICWLVLPVPAPTPFLPPPSGHYFPEKSTKHVFDSAPSHSISARTKTFRVDSTPGPPQPRWPMADRVEDPGQGG